MRILIIGGTGTIGQKVAANFSERHDVITVGRNSGDIQVDIADEESIVRMYESAGHLDAVVCIAGEAKWAAFKELSYEDYFIGLRSKLMGQVNIVRLGQEHLAQDGSFTLTTGILADHPVLLTTSAAMVNGGIHSFVRAAALELPHRINVVSAGLVEDSVKKYAEYFPGHDPVSMDSVVAAYRAALEGSMTGEVIQVYPARFS